MDASTRCVYTSGQKGSLTKNVLLHQNKCFHFDQYGFSKVLVAPSFDFAKTLFRKVEGFEIWRTEVKTSSRLEHGAGRYRSMSLLPCPERWSPPARPCTTAPPLCGRRRSVSLRPKPCPTCSPPPPDSPSLHASPEKDSARATDASRRAAQHSAAGAPLVSDPRRPGA